MSTVQTSLHDLETDRAADTNGIVVQEVDEAVACGRLGCRETTGLVQAVVKGIGTRVVCPEHLGELVEQEVSRA
ncbi:hypothetical protein [Natrinema sp. 1APR25-10V2]|uniref:hypothetical protein n=1 Tax=Natrinema sp. 1APR25-10V2 TaxID=2951081 RepID=UPI002876A1E4|nr:hypothetical protein [Natrinema sp. 1APR25-10V2]MDS0478669.1 hypothetical protein [Natrinema sp. 1APR25-10V2]